MPIILKPAAEGDARAIAEISVETWRAAFRGAMPDAVLDGLSVDEREAGFRQILSSAASGSSTSAWRRGFEAHRRFDLSRRFG